MGVCMSMERKEKREKRIKVSTEVDLTLEMPGQILCSNGATKTCCLHTKQGCKGTNQDCMLAWEGFIAEEKTVFLGVFDGHGPNGHLVASEVRDVLPKLLCTLPKDSLQGCNSIPRHHNILKPIKIFNANDAIAGDVDGCNQINLTGDQAGNAGGYKNWERLFTSAFHEMDRHLRESSKISCLSSGSTAVAMLVQGKDLVVGSVGDSRAILATRSSVDGSLEAHQLTIDSKPDSPGERERIQQCQGRVFALQHEPHILRLWLPTENTPGLAMSRAFGDLCLKECGLIATPKISQRELTDKDEFIVLATDGVWDVLNNSEVMEAISSSSSKEEAAQCVVEAAINGWKRRGLEQKIDDCAVVCHFLKDYINFAHPLHKEH